MHNTTFINVRNGKMPIRTFVMFIIILLLAVSATWWFTRSYYNTSETTDKAFLRLDSSLNSATTFLLKACNEDSLYMEDKINQPGFEKIVTQWKPKVDSTIFVTRQIIHLLDELKEGINQSSFSETDNLSKTKRHTQIELSNNLNKLKVGHALYDSLKNYATKLFSISVFKSEKYLEELPVLKTIEGYNNADDWNKSYLFDLNLIEASAILTKIQYEVWCSANFMTDLYTSQWSCDLLFKEDFPAFKPLISQNSSYFLPGQTLNISVGLGAYTTSVKPTIFINGVKQNLNKDGIAIYKKKINGENGGLIPVKISFPNPNTGKIISKSVELLYEVLQKNNK